MDTVGDDQTKAKALNREITKLNVKVENLKKKIAKIEQQRSSEVENDYVSG